MVRAVLEWAACKARFDTAFVESLQERLALGYELTPGQKAALRNIITKCSIPV
jgi:hypothetical protein